MTATAELVIPGLHRIPEKGHVLVIDVDGTPSLLCAGLTRACRVWEDCDVCADADAADPDYLDLVDLADGYAHDVQHQPGPARHDGGPAPWQAPTDWCRHVLRYQDRAALRALAAALASPRSGYRPDARLAPGRYLLKARFADSTGIPITTDTAQLLLDLPEPADASA